MISATDLRIGNWINDHIGHPRQVAYVGETIGVHNDIGGTQKYQHNPIISGDLNELSPIPLKPGILKKAGFVDEVLYLPDITDQINPDVYLTVDWQEGEIGIRRNNKGREGEQFWFPCKYLHQLQNIYHSLTQTELEVTL